MGTVLCNLRALMMRADNAPHSDAREAPHFLQPSPARAGGRGRKATVSAIIGGLFAIASLGSAAEPLQSTSFLPATSPGASARTPETTASTFRTYMVRPRDTDPAIDLDNSPHVALIGDCTKQRGRLYLFFPGTNGVPSPDSPLLQLAARNCLHAISLTYPNESAVINDCRRDPAKPDCFAAWRLEKIDGVDRSDKINVTPSNSIKNRLLKFLQYLAARHPADGWDLYIEGGAVRWDNVIVSGQSQGGGQAAMLAKIHLVARVAMFGSITDAVGSLRGLAPSWESTPGATPPERYFGFAHQRDNFWSAIQRGWIALGLEPFGPIVNVDGERPPFGGTHRLTTSVACINPIAANCAHTTVITPKLSSQFLPVWEYMLGLRPSLKGKGIGEGVNK